jgi:hypothetical protein
LLAACAAAIVAVSLTLSPSAAAAADTMVVPCWPMNIKEGSRQ